MFQIIFQNLLLLLITQSKTQRCNQNQTIHFRLFNVEACVAALAALNHNRLAAQQAGSTDVELSKMDEDILKVECQSLTFEQGHRKSRTSSEKVQRRTSPSINLERRQTTIKRPHLESRASPCQAFHGGTNAMACNFT
jgi:hypothetical protein